MKKYISFDPVSVGLLRPIAVVPRVDRLADLIEELGFSAALAAYRPLRCHRVD